MSSDLRVATKRLERLHDLCITESEDDKRTRIARQEAEERRLAEMSPLERFVYTTTKDVNELQQRQIEYNDKMGSNVGWGNSSAAIAMRNEMNKMKMHLRSRYDKIPPPKTDEERRQRDSLKKVLERVKRADRAASGLKPGSARASNLYGELDAPLGDGEAGGPPNNKTGVTEWDGDEASFPGGGGGYEPVTLDQEFQNLMTIFRENDQEIDRMLDHIMAGVVTLNEQAKVISVELKTQDLLITEADKKMDNIHSQLVGVNKKLKKTIVALDKDKMCLYIICLLLLLGLIGVILVVTKVVK